MNSSNFPDVNLNLNVRGLPQSATLVINEKSDELRRQGKKVCKLGLGQSPFPVPQSVVEELKINAHQKDYLPVKGLRKLREAVADYHCRIDRICYYPDDVLIGPGSKELMFLLQYVYYGDLVIPTPSWVSYSPQAQIIGRQVRWLCTSKKNNWLFTAEELEAHCKNDYLKPRIVILNYPSNPVGATYTEDQLKDIADVARKHKIILLSDEIYGELHHKGEHISIAKYYEEGTIISSGLSKWCGAGGWSLGTFTFPESLRWLLDAIAVMASETFTSTSAPIQYAAVRAFQGGSDIENYLWRSRWILDKLGNKIAKQLLKVGIDTPTPEGGFYLFLDFCNFKEKLRKKNIIDSTTLCSRLFEETGVAILPGKVFGMKPEELTARLAYVDFDGVAAMDAALKINFIDEIDDTFLKNYCQNVFKAISLITNWVKN
ncbi:MAG: aminotransferase class I/II-fold pyridoxal phosphate-dependent enzyme [Bacteroidetes bacterium]|nr:aminotransferase class I/II-fold pyridoxal phosphate-dependent enzyme [Bacteroidota bacterium]